LSLSLNPEKTTAGLKKKNYRQNVFKTRKSTKKITNCLSFQLFVVR